MKEAERETKGGCFSRRAARQEKNGVLGTARKWSCVLSFLFQTVQIGVRRAREWEDGSSLTVHQG